MIAFAELCKIEGAVPIVSPVFGDYHTYTSIHRSELRWFYDQS